MKQQIRAELENATRARDSLRAQLREMKGKLEYMTVDKIDEQLRRLEHRMSHSSQSLQEEKKTLDDMKRLKASRSTVAQYNDRFEKLSSDDEGRSAIVQRLQQADAQLNNIKAEEEQLRNQLAEIRSKEAEQKSDIPSLIQEREDCRAVINELYSKVKDIRAEFKIKVDEYYERQREFKAQQQEEHKERYMLRFYLGPVFCPKVKVMFMDEMHAAEHHVRALKHHQSDTVSNAPLMRGHVPHAFEHSSRVMQSAHHAALEFAMVHCKMLTNLSDMAGGRGSSRNGRRGRLSAKLGKQKWQESPLTKRYSY